jgi:Ca2+-binding EF-hand superfamily protein
MSNNSDDFFSAETYENTSPADKILLVHSYSNINSSSQAHHANQANDLNTQHYEHAFQIFISDRNDTSSPHHSTIKASNVISVLKGLGYSNVDKQLIVQLLKKFPYSDSTASDTAQPQLSFNQFAAALTNFDSAAYELDKAKNLMRSFELHDLEQSGFIEKKTLRGIVSNIKHKQSSDKDIEKLIQYAENSSNDLDEDDKQGNNLIDYRKLVNKLCSTNLQAAAGE